MDIARKILSILFIILALSPIAFAAIVHLADNAKGGMPTVFDFKSIAYCSAVSLSLFALAYFTWR